MVVVIEFKQIFLEFDQILILLNECKSGRNCQNHCELNVKVGKIA